MNQENGYLFDCIEREWDLKDTQINTQNSALNVDLFQKFFYQSNLLKLKERKGEKEQEKKTHKLLTVQNSFFYEKVDIGQKLSILCLLSWYSDIRPDQTREPIHLSYIVQLHFINNNL